MNPKKVFDYGLLYHHYSNTAYPLTPLSYRKYRINDESLHADFLEKEWAKANELSLYIHIPFCKQRCKFCEYTVLDDNDQLTEDLYVSLLLREIEMYRKIIGQKKILGFDVGGGTPSKISLQNLQLITDAVTSGFNFDNNVCFSIETTPAIAAQEPEKIKAIFQMGYERISMGVQTISEKLLNELGREGTTQIYEKAVKNIRTAGYKRFNIDLMYGFLHQTEDDFENTLQYAISLNPEYITLYRNRYKGTKLENEAEGVSLYKIIRQYRLAYDLLVKNGYEANHGKNTFSKLKNDYGTSDYLTKRVINGVSYLGLGLGAQSFGIDYLAYNQGAASKQLEKYKEKIERNLYPIQDIYPLSIQESIAKMVSVAFYFGFVDFQEFKKRFGLSFEEHFASEIEFVLTNEFMEIIGDRIYLTKRGSDYINGIIPLFYSDDSKIELANLFHNKKKSTDGEREFLSAYNVGDFVRPSIAGDIIVFAGDANNIESAKSLSLVLIRRGEHPFMNDWALPGGFVQPDETIEQTVVRELEEEAGLSNLKLKQLHVFSDLGRDPRAWIISCVFWTYANQNMLKLKFGEDAIDARIFDIQLTKIKSDNTNTNQYSLRLLNEDYDISAIIEKQEVNGETQYDIISQDGIAFDHAKIIFYALENLK